MTATREKKIAFIQSFGRTALKDRLSSMIDELGTDFLNDAQIALMTERQVEDARYTNRNTIRNREAIRAELRRA